jgi:DNA ligase (NAD+)
MKVTKDVLIQINKDPNKFFKSNKLGDLEKLYLKAKDAYFNSGAPLFSDAIFDLLEDYITSKNPKSKVLKYVGSSGKGTMVKLPYFMGSLDKVKPESKALKRWLDKYHGPYLVSDKLDGISGLYVVQDGIQKLYTRGNGEEGQDISHLISLMDFPEPCKNIAIRGELIAPKNKVNNSRNIIAGLVHRKKVSKNDMKNVHFVCYEIIDQELLPSDQTKLLKSLKHHIVNSKVYSSLSEDTLKEILVKRKKDSEYDIDGIVINDNQVNKRNISGNPKYSVAFKMLFSDQVLEATIKEVSWAKSKDKYLKPRVEIDPPIKISGVTIKFATAFNAKYVCENKLGPGAIIRITRSGDVIPYITSIEKKASKPQMPKENYYWNETETDIILDSDDDIEVVIKKITYFFKTLKAKGISEKTIQKFVEGGYDTIQTIISASKNDIMKLPGVKDKMADNIIESIKVGFSDNKLEEVMQASGCFGRGFGGKKINLILQGFPEVLSSKKSKKEITEILVGIKGIEEKTAQTFYEGISIFNKFYNSISKYIKKPQKKVENKNIKKIDKLNGLNIVFTGFRDSELEEIIINSGGTLKTTLAGNTNILVVKDNTVSNKKTEQAKDSKIKIYTKDQFYKFIKN